MVELVHGLHHKSPKVVKLVHRLHHGCHGGDHGCPEVVKLVMGLYHQRYEKMKFMMELHHGSSKECGASVEASLYGFPHPCEPVSGRLHKWD